MLSLAVVLFFPVLFADSFLKLKLINATSDIMMAITVHAFWGSKYRFEFSS